MTAVEIPGSLTSEEASDLHTDHCRESFGWLGAEITSFVGIKGALVEVGIVVIVMVAEPFVVGHLSVGDFPLDLYPTVGERDILEIMKSDTHFRNRPGIPAFDKIAAR